MSWTQVRTAWMVGLLASCALAVASDDDPVELGEIQDQLIVELLPGASIVDFNTRYSTTLIDSLPTRNLHLVEFPPGMTLDQFEVLAEGDPTIDDFESNVEAAEPGGNTRSFYGTTFMPQYADQASAFGGIDQAQALSNGGGAIVAVLDTGVDATHPALVGGVLTGWNFVDNNDDTRDVGNGVFSNGNSIPDEFVGHGTFVAGGVRLVAPEAQILPVKVLDSDGRSTSFRVAIGVYYAIDRGADVINLSLATPFPNFVLEDAVHDARERGVIVVASAGNTASNLPPQYPAAFTDDAIAVAATTMTGVRTTFTSYGQQITISAPGIDVAGTFPGNNYRLAEGSSFATPWVSGAAALLKSSRSNVSMRVARDVFQATATPIDALNPGFETMLGAGLIDVQAAVSMVANACPGDFDLDGRVDLTDFADFLSDWAESEATADVTLAGVCAFGDGGDGVTLSDFSCYLANWAVGCP